jgi:hypothetical protein
MFRAQLAAGDEHAGAVFTLGTAWLREGNSGTFRSWTDIAFLCKHCDGPIVLKGIQAVWDASCGHRTPAWTASLWGFLHVLCRTLVPCIGTCELMAPPVHFFGGTIRLVVLLAFSVLSRGSTRHRGCAVRRASSTPRRARDPPVEDWKMS